MKNKAEIWILIFLIIILLTIITLFLKVHFKNHHEQNSPKNDIYDDKTEALDICNHVSENSCFKITNDVLITHGKSLI